MPPEISEEVEVVSESNYVEKEYLTGFELLNYLKNPLLGQEAIVEGIIFKNTVNIFYSDPGVGKTVIGINMLASMSAGFPVFGYFPMKRFAKCSYLQLEGSKEENLGRLKELHSEISFDCHNIAWHSNPVFVENEDSQETMFKELQEFQPEVIFIDSFYCMTSKGLSKDEGFLPARQLVQRIKSNTGAAIIIFHHSTKPQHDQLGAEVEKEDPFMGSQYLKAFADMMVRIKRAGDNKVLMKVTKASRNNEGVREIALRFNKINWTVLAIPEETTQSAIGEIIKYLKKEFAKGSEVTIDMIVKATSYTKRHIRRLRNDGHFNHIADFKESDGKSTVWLPKKIEENEKP
jgi:hypothetical protein